MMDAADPFERLKTLGIDLAAILHGERSFAYHAPVAGQDRRMDIETSKPSGACPLPRKAPQGPRTCRRRPRPFPVAPLSAPSDDAGPTSPSAPRNRSGRPGATCLRIADAAAHPGPARGR